MGHNLKSFAAAAAAIVVAASGFAGSADAKSRKSPEGYRYVTAEASTGGKTVTGPVREGRRGDQVRTPGGNWYDCEISCEYTLRRLTVDFWESQQDGGFVSPGYLSFDLDLDTGEIYRKSPY
jgi:hypothetical protein